MNEGPSLSWLYASWIYNYLQSVQYRRGALDATFCQWLATGPWFSPSTPVSSINKNDRHNITDILLKMALSSGGVEIVVLSKSLFLMKWYDHANVFYTWIECLYWHITGWVAMSTLTYNWVSSDVYTDI